MSSTSTIFQSLDSLSLYLEIRKYQELLAKQKELYHSNQDGTILLKEPRELIQLRNSLEEAIFATSRFGVDPTNPEELEAWFQKHQSYLAS